MIVEKDAAYDILLTHRSDRYLFLNSKKHPELWRDKQPYSAFSADTKHEPIDTFVYQNDLYVFDPESVCMHKIHNFKRIIKLMHAHKSFFVSRQNVAWDLTVKCDEKWNSKTVYHMNTQRCAINVPEQAYDLPKDVILLENDKKDDKVDVPPSDDYEKENDDLDYGTEEPPTEAPAIVVNLPNAWIIVVVMVWVIGLVLLCAWLVIKKFNIIRRAKKREKGHIKKVKLSDVNAMRNLVKTDQESGEDSCKTKQPPQLRAWLDSISVIKSPTATSSPYMQTSPTSRPYSPK